MSKMQYVCESDVLMKDVSHVFKLLIVMTNSKQWPILATQTLFESEPA